MSNTFWNVVNTLHILYVMHYNAYISPITLRLSDAVSYN